MGSVAKTQARSQQASTQTLPFADQLNKDDELMVQRVAETEEAARQSIDANRENPDKRKRRRLKRNRRQLADGAGDAETASQDESAADGEQLGILIDLRV